MGTNGIPKGGSTVTLLVFHLLFEREIHGFAAHVKHIVGFLFNTVVLEAARQFSNFFPVNIQ